MFGDDYVPTAEERERWAALFNVLLGSGGDEFAKLRDKVDQEEAEMRIVQHYAGLKLVDETPMAPEELRSLVKRLGGQASTARLLGMRSCSVRIWLEGGRKIRPQMAAILRHLGNTPGLAPIRRRVRPSEKHRR